MWCVQKSHFLRIFVEILFFENFFFPGLDTVKIGLPRSFDLLQINACFIFVFMVDMNANWVTVNIHVCRFWQEVEQMKRSNTTKEDEMQSRHTLEKKRLPKILKSEAKTRANMFKQSLRLSTIGSPEDDRSKMKQVSHSLL